MLLSYSMSVLIGQKRKDSDIWDFHFSYEPIIIDINISDYIEVINIVNSPKIYNITNNWIKRHSSIFEAVENVKNFIYKYHSSYKQKQKMFIEYSTNLIPDVSNMIIDY